MIRSDYWQIKPHTERKLVILDKYLAAWCDIIFKYYYLNLNWKAWSTPYFVDCFSGRGMYHKDGKLNSVNGSPIIAIERFIEKKAAFEAKYQKSITPKIRLIEYNTEFAKELEEFVKPYKSQLDIKVFCDDFNTIIEGIVSETGYSPAFFFVDAGGIKELKGESVEKIVMKSGPRDILLNYIVDGPSRIGGLAQKIVEGKYKGKRLAGAIKTIQTLEDFHNMEIARYLDETNNDCKDALIAYIENVLHANNKVKSITDRLQTVVYDMKDTQRQRLIYYLIFSSRKEVATKVMKSIFKDSKNTESNQRSLFDPDFMEFN